MDLENYTCADLANVYKSAKELGHHAVLNTETRKGLCKKPIKYLDSYIFVNKLLELEPQEMENPFDMNSTLYSLAKECMMQTDEPQQKDLNKSRWEHIMSNSDSKQLWRAINWKGEIGQNHKDDGPSDEDFKNHYEDLLNPEGLDAAQLPDITSNVYVPILDDPVTPLEVENVIQKQLKLNKGCGPDGVTGNIYKLLPVK